MWEKILEKIDRFFIVLAEKMIIIGHFLGLNRRWTMRVFVVVSSIVFNYPRMTKVSWLIPMAIAIVTGGFIAFIVLSIAEKEFDRQNRTGDIIYDNPGIRLLMLSIYPLIILIFFVVGEIFAPTHSYWKITQYWFNPYFAIYFPVNPDATTRFQFRDIFRVIKQRVIRRVSPFRLPTNPPA